MNNQQGYTPLAQNSQQVSNNPWFMPYGNQMVQPYNNQIVQSQAPQEPPKTKINYRPVGGLEEVKSLSIDWDGSLYFLEDETHLYKKQYIDGVVRTTAFEKVVIPEPPKIEYATKREVEELTNTINELKKLLE